jgi:polar amino acid transport system substrate-binding protein
VRRLTVFVSVLALAVGFTACSSHNAKNVYTCPNPGPSVGFKGVKSGKLTVETALPAPAWWNGDNVDSLTGGYEFEMAKDLCARLGVSKVRIVNVDFTALQAGKTKDFDLALSQITITDARKKNEDFSDSYFSSDQGILVNPGTTVTSVADAKKLQWGVQTGTTSEIFLNTKIKPDKTPKSFGQTTEMFTALKAKRIDAVLLDTSIVLAQAPLQNAQVVGQFRTGEVYGALLPKGSANLALVNTALAKLKSDGTLDALNTKWLVPAFKGDPSKVPYIPVP